MSHGHLKIDESSNIIFGQVVTRDLNERIKLEENKMASGDKSPSHNVMAKAPAGHMYHAGVAWPYSNKNGARGYQLKLEDPSFGSEPIMFWATPVGLSNSEWVLQLAREEEKKQAA